MAQSPGVAEGCNSANKDQYHVEICLKDYMPEMNKESKIIMLVVI